MMGGLGSAIGGLGSAIGGIAGGANLSKPSIDNLGLAQKIAELMDAGLIQMPDKGFTPTEKPMKSGGFIPQEPSKPTGFSQVEQPKPTGFSPTEPSPTITTMDDKPEIGYKIPQEWDIDKKVEAKVDPLIEQARGKTLDEFLKANEFIEKEVDPNDLIFREEGQNRTSQVRKDFPEGEGYNTIVVSKDSAGNLEILDGHNRAVVAKERGDKINAISIPEEIYHKALDEGYDEIEISYAALEHSRNYDEASNLNSQFPGANVAQRGQDVLKKYFDNIPSNPQLVDIWNKANK